MTIPYVEEEYFWIPRIHGQDPETGTYAVLYGGSSWQFVSDQDPNTIPFTPVTGLQQRALHLPAAFPRKAFLSGVNCSLETSTVPNQVSAYAGWIDKGGEFFYSGTPNGAENGSNFIRANSLFLETFRAERRETWVHNFAAPKLLDRDAGDLLCVKIDLGVGGVIAHVGFRFLVPVAS